MIPEFPKFKKLEPIDSLAFHGIFEKAYPGCQVLVAQNGKVFYQKSFGDNSFGILSILPLKPMLRFERYFHK